MVITLWQRKEKVHSLSLVNRFKEHHYLLRGTFRRQLKLKSSCRIRSVKIPVLKPISNGDFSVTNVTCLPITSPGFKIHLNEVICKGLHHSIEYKLDWSAIQQSKYEWWDNHTSKTAYFFSDKTCCSAQKYWENVIRYSVNDYAFKKIWILICLALERHNIS